MHLKVRNYSEHTLTAYTEDIKHLREALGDVVLETVVAGDIRHALAGLHGRGYASGSLARMLSAWRSLFGWLAQQGRLEANPCVGIRPPRGVKKLPNALTPDEMAAMLATPAGPETPLEIQDRAMFELMYSSGLRLAELIGLTPARIDLSSAEVRVTGKGNKTRIVPVGRMAIDALQAWLTVYGQVARDPEALFVGTRGQRIAPSVVRQRLKRLALTHGISRRVHPHALRHSFASHVLQSSGDLRAVQEMLGHASLSTTQVYTHLDFQHLAKVYDATHPRAKK